MIDRRELLKRIALALGGALSSSTFAGALADERAGGDGGAWQPQVLKGDLSELVATLVELIIPRTDTPGARDAGVPEFIDLMLAEWMRPAERARFLAGLEEVEKRAAKRYRAPFVECSAAEQTAILQHLEDKALKQRAKAEKKAEKAARKAEKRAAKGKEPDRKPPADEPRPFFSHLKELTLVGYYTSEVGATEELNYVIVFDDYQSCVPLAEVGAAWSS